MIVLKLYSVGTHKACVYCVDLLFIDKLLLIAVVIFADAKDEIGIL